jgi:hypothetical protein
VVRKKVLFDKNGVDKSSSLMVGESSDYEEEDGENGEDELYNLMRGHTSLMITEDSSDSGEESKEQGEDDDEGNLEISSAVPESGSSSVEPDGSTSVGGFLPKWGNRPIKDPRDQEFADEWKTKSETYYRRSRNERMEKGGSPPPKFHEDNLFTEGCSRKKDKSTYKLKGESDCWGDHQEDKDFENTVEDYTNGRLRPSKRLKEQETEEMHQQESTSKGVGWEVDSNSESDDEDNSSEDEEKIEFCTDEKEDDDDYSDDEGGTNMSCDRWIKDEESPDSSKEEGGGEETSSEDDTIGEPSDDNDSVDSDNDDDRDDGTIGQIFKEIRNGTFNALKRRKRFEGQCRNERKVFMGSSYLEDDDGSDVATRGDCVMSTSEALHRLTLNKNDKLDKEDEWLIIKVPTNGKN